MVYPGLSRWEDCRSTVWRGRSPRRAYANAIHLYACFPEILVSGIAKAGVSAWKAEELRVEIGVVLSRPVACDEHGNAQDNQRNAELRWFVHSVRPKIHVQNYGIL